MTMKVGQDINVDGVTINIKVEGNSTPKMESQLIMSETELTVPTNVITQLIFRKPVNSNAMIICTGFQYNNQWYGDRPDDGEYINPFTNTTEYKGTKPLEKSVLEIQETYQGLIIKWLRLDNKEDLLPLTVHRVGGIYNDWNYEAQPQDTTLNGVSAKSYTYQTGNTLLAYDTEVIFEFTTGGVRYEATLPRVAFENNLGTYRLEADNTQALFSLFSPMS